MPTIIEKKVLSDGRTVVTKKEIPDIPITDVVEADPDSLDKPYQRSFREMEVGNKKRLRDVTMRFNRKEDEFQCRRCILKVAGKPSVGGAPDTQATSINSMLEEYRSSLMWRGYTQGLVWLEFVKTGVRTGSSTHYMKLLLEVPLRKKPDHMDWPD